MAPSPVVSRAERWRARRAKPLSWPWADDDAPLDTPAQRWGVETAHERVLLCGSGARRGGAVSGLGGHNAAMAALELLG